MILTPREHQIKKSIDKAMNDPTKGKDMRVDNLKCPNCGHKELTKSYSVVEPMDFESFLNLLGTDRKNAAAKVIWDTLRTNHYLIFKNPNNHAKRSNKKRD